MWSHALAGTPCRVCLKDFVRYAFDGGNFHPLMGYGREGDGCVYVGVIFCWNALMSTADSGAVHSVHHLARGDIAFYADVTNCNTCNADRPTG